MKHCFTRHHRACITPAATRPKITRQNRRTRSIETHLSEADTETHATHTASATPTQRMQLPQQTPQRPPPRPPTRRTRRDHGTRTKHTPPRPEHMPCNHAPRANHAAARHNRAITRNTSTQTPHVTRPDVEHISPWRCREGRPCCRHSRTHSTHTTDATAPRPRTLAASGAATGANTGCASAPQRCRAATAWRKCMCHILTHMNTLAADTAPAPADVPRTTAYARTRATATDAVHPQQHTPRACRVQPMHVTARKQHYL